jgi:hypothetical protein
MMALVECFARCRLFSPPPCGEGSGVGGAVTAVCADPPLQLSPARGERAHRWCRLRLVQHHQLSKSFSARALPALLHSGPTGARR